MSVRRPPPLIGASAAVYRALLLLYPPRFRREFGDEAVGLYLERYRADYERRGALGILLLWSRTLRNVLVHGPLERLAAGRDAAGRFDARQAIRSLGRDPALMVVGTLSLAIGIGATTALFSLLKGVLLEPLPFPEPHELVQLWEVNAQLDRMKEGPSPLNVADWTELATGVEGIAAWYLTSGTQRDDGLPPEEVRSAQVTPDFFRVMGWEAALGRTPYPEEVERYGPMVLSDRLWRRRYGADPGVVGRRLTSSGRSYEVVGVMPPEFQFPDPSVEAWLAWDLRDVYGDNPPSRTWRFLRVVARMRPDATLASVEREFSNVAATLAERHPIENRGWSVRATPLHDEIVGDVRPALLAAFGAVSLILFMACVNVANLLLARVPARSRELAVRQALGAGPARTASQLVLENLVLAGCGGAFGLLVAWGLVRVLVAFDAGRIPRLATVTIDASVLTFSLAIALLASLIFGLAPILRATRTPPAAALRDQGGRATASAAQSRLRRALVAAQISTALVLLVGAGLFAATFTRLRAVDPGFDPESALTFRISLDPQGDGEARVVPYYEGLLVELSSIPGVVAVGAAQTLPLNPVGNDFTRPYREVGSGTPSADAPTVQMRIVMPGYFDAIGMSFEAGSGTTGLESLGEPLVAVVNRAFADRLWPGRDAVGETFELDFREGWRPYRVLGVVSKTPHYGLRVEARPEVYLAHRQSPYVAMSLVMRTDRDPQALIGAVRQTVLSYPPSQPVHHFVTLEQLIADAVAEERFLVALMTTFGIIALMLACSGVFGVMAYVVGQRTRELGLRVALGARRASLMGWVVGRAAVLTATGVAIGLVASVALGHAIRSLLFDVQPWDPLTLVLVSALLFTAALAAAAIPARRATAVDPATVLRSD